MIGFLETNYSAIESSGIATVMFGLISGGVQSDVNVQLGFSEETAQGITKLMSHSLCQHYIKGTLLIFFLCKQMELTLTVLETSSHSIVPVPGSIPLMCHW